MGEKAAKIGWAGPPHCPPSLLIALMIDDAHHHVVILCASWDEVK